jgi:hypothetical protein
MSRRHWIGLLWKNRRPFLSLCSEAFRSFRAARRAAVARQEIA